jgi:predicted nucleotidyltransferase component of viral defense system
MASDPPLTQIDLAAWVARGGTRHRGFREAVHIVISAISASAALRTRMVMKGGLLMAIRYDSTRFTRDIDFSTRDKYTPGAERALLAELEQQLELFNDGLGYDTMCRRQRTKLNPQRPDASFPTLTIGIGYAARSDGGQLQRLLHGQSPHLVEVDYSYNEAVLNIEVLRLSNGQELQIYSHLNFIAEKLRSLLQQPVRRRNRRQDVYDLHLLVTHGVVPRGDTERRRLLDMLRQTCAERGITAQPGALTNPQVHDMARAEYASLADEVDGELPVFDDAYRSVRALYNSLPW